MKKNILSLALVLVTVLGTSGFMMNYQNGIAGFTGAPGESTCSNPGCHSGGSSTTSGITISSNPAFAASEYTPGAIYNITVTIAASAYSRFGFGCEILDENLGNAGTMQSPGAGVKFLNAGARKNAVHTVFKSRAGSADFTFDWVAPLTDTATFYVAGNAVNGTGTPSGDFPVTPVILQLNAFVADPDPVGVKEIKANLVNDLSVSPNPANGFTAISYSLMQSQTLVIQLVNINGAVIKEFINEKESAGTHSHVLELNQVTAGVYFIKTSANGKKVAQKLIVVQ